MHRNFREVSLEVGVRPAPEKFWHFGGPLMMMTIGLNPGPRARTVKTGPRHLRTRPDLGQNRLGPHKGIPSGEARQCTPAGTEAVISALAPTWNNTNQYWSANFIYQ